MNEGYRKGCELVAAHLLGAAEAGEVLALGVWHRGRNGRGNRPELLVFRPVSRQDGTITLLVEGFGWASYYVPGERPELFFRLPIEKFDWQRYSLEPGAILEALGKLRPTGCFQPPANITAARRDPRHPQYETRMSYQIQRLPSIGARPKMYA